MTPEEQHESLILKAEELYQELMSYDSIPQEAKDAITEIRNKRIAENEEYKKWLEKNKNKEIIGYDPETFKPIFE